MKKVYCIVCLLILTVVVIESPLFSNETVDADAIASTKSQQPYAKIEISCYELYIYDAEREDLVSNFDDYLNTNNYKFEKEVKENNRSAILYTLTNMDTNIAFSIYEEANDIIKSQNNNAVINLSARGSVNEDCDIMQVAKSIYKKLSFTPQNILKSNNFFEADGLGYIGALSQEMQIVVRASEGNDFCEFIIGIPSVLNEY